MKIDYLEVNNHPGGLVKITAVVEGDLQVCSQIATQIKETPYTLDIKPLKKGRSLDANAYYQKLLDLLSGALGTSREELHHIMLQRYGVTKCDKDGDPIVFPTQLGKDGHRQARYCEAIREGTLNGKPCMWWREIKGSSEMNTAEFSQLLDGLISECKEVGVRIPDEIDYKRQTTKP